MLAGWKSAVSAGHAIGQAVHGVASDQFDVDGCESGDRRGGIAGADVLSAGGDFADAAQHDAASCTREGKVGLRGETHIENVGASAAVLGDVGRGVVGRAVVMDGASAGGQWAGDRVVGLIGIAIGTGGEQTAFLFFRAGVDVVFFERAKVGFGDEVHASVGEINIVEGYPELQGGEG